MSATHVALLYSIVLTPQRRVVMEDLRAMAAGLGFSAPRTLVSSGNLIFAAEAGPIPAIEARLEVAFAATFGRHVDIIVKSADDWRALVRANPFPQEAAADGNSVNVRVMREPLPATAAADLAGYLTKGERVAVIDRNLWMHFPGKPSESRLLQALTPKRQGIGTARNWNTVRRLGEMLD
jgi:uncharacterized protein (DUF1697 family)